MSSPRQKILVAIANFGTKNDGFLRQLLDEYHSMTHDVHVIVFSNVHKELPSGVELRVEIPKGDPWSFPFAHKRMLAERLEDFDLFIYSEDDTPITEKNISAFLEVQELLPEDEIAGFMRWEKGPDGQRHYSSVHSHFHWNPRSVVERGGETFAEFTNEHSACYILTRRQMQKAILSGGYLVEPHEGPYDLLVSAATDPYTQCGMRKLVCTSRISEFVLPHLPNKYVGQMGLAESDFLLQLRALHQIATGERPSTVLLSGETETRQASGAKSYYEPSSPDVLEMIPKGVKKVLSYGCGWGELEADLAKRGMDVTAIPLDSVIGICAEARQIRVVYGNGESVLDSLDGAAFDCILLSNVLHLVPLPEQLLARLTVLLNPKGSILATSPHYSSARNLLREIKRSKRTGASREEPSSVFHRTTARVLGKWLRRAHLSVRNVVLKCPARYRWLKMTPPSFLRAILADDVTILASKQ